MYTVIGRGSVERNSCTIVVYSGSLPLAAMLRVARLAR